MYNIMHSSKCERNQIFTCTYLASAIRHVLLSSHQFRRWQGLPVHRTDSNHYG